MKTLSFTNAEVLSVLVSSVIGLFPGEWNTARIIAFSVILTLTIVVGCAHFVTFKRGKRSAGTLKKQYLDEFTLDLIRTLRTEMDALADEVGEARKIGDIFTRLLQQVATCLDLVCEIEKITASSGLSSAVHLDLLATKRGLEAVQKTLEDEFKDFCPHSYIHPVKRPYRVHEVIMSLVRIMKTA